MIAVPSRVANGFLLDCWTAVSPLPVQQSSGNRILVRKLDSVFVATVQQSKENQDAKRPT